MVCISVKSLYESNLATLFCDIVPDYDDGKLKFYDLYNDDGVLACCDGEECVIEQVGSEILTLINSNGEGTIYFNLTFEEADIALFLK